MDTKHVYRNASLEARRRQELARQRADEALRASKQGKLSPEKQIEAGFGGSRPRDGLPLAGWIVRIRMPRDAAYDEAFRALLSAAAAHRSPMLDEERYVRALAAAGRAHPARLGGPGAADDRAVRAGNEVGVTSDERDRLPVSSEGAAAGPPASRARRRRHRSCARAAQ